MRIVELSVPPEINELIAQSITPSRTWYLVALMILMIALALAAWGISAFVQTLTDEPQYLFAPGIGGVALMCIAGAAAVFVVTIVRRTSNKKNLQSNAQMAAGNIPPSPTR